VFSAGTLLSSGQSPASTTTPLTTSPLRAGASALLRTLSRRRRRSSASATMTSLSPSASSSSSSSLIPQQGELSDDWRAREPTSVSSFTSTFSSVYVEEVGDTVERIAAGKWQRLKPTSTHRYMRSTSSPSGVEQMLIAQSSCGFTQTTQSVGVPRPPLDQLEAFHMTLPSSSITSLPFPLYCRSRDTPEATRLARVASVPATSTQYQRNGNGLAVRSRSSLPERITDEPTPSVCESERPATTETITSTSTDVWRPY